MEEKIDLILAAQDVQETDMKELKDDIKSLKNDIALLPQIGSKLRSVVQGDVTGIQLNVAANTSRLTDLENRIAQLTTKNEELVTQLKQLDSGEKAVNPPSILIIQGIKYCHNNLQKLPPNINLSRAYTIETDDSIYFQLEHSWPSGFAPAKIDYMGNSYSTLEQGYAHRMAINSGDKDVAQLIIKEHQPKKM